MWACGRSVCTTTLGWRGSETSTAVKFFGALSCASHRMRRPSGAIWIDMPSPMPPNPSSAWCAMSLKFQVTGWYEPGCSGLFSATAMWCSLGVVDQGGISVISPAMKWRRGQHRPLRVRLRPQVRAQRLLPVRDGGNLFLALENLGIPLQVGHEVGGKARVDLHAPERLGEDLLRHGVAFGCVERINHICNLVRIVLEIARGFLPGL